MEPSTIVVSGTSAGVPAHSPAFPVSVPVSVSLSVSLSVSASNSAQDQGKALSPERLAKAFQNCRELAAITGHLVVLCNEKAASRAADKESLYHEALADSLHQDPSNIAYANKTITQALLSKPVMSFFAMNGWPQPTLEVLVRYMEDKLARENLNLKKRSELEEQKLAKQKRAKEASAKKSLKKQSDEAYWNAIQDEERRFELNKKKNAEKFAFGVIERIALGKDRCANDQFALYAAFEAVGPYEGVKAFEQLKHEQAAEAARVAAIKAEHEAAAAAAAAAVAKAAAADEADRLRKLSKKTSRKNVQKLRKTLGTKGQKK